MLYQFNLDLSPVAHYKTMKEASKVLSISWKTISSAVINKNKCHGKWFFSKSPEIKIDKIYFDESLSVKTSIVLTKSMFEDFNYLTGQRNKQQIIRELLNEWITKEKEKKIMKYNQNFDQHADAVLVILNTHGMTQKNFSIESALKILGMKKEPEALQKCLLKNQFKIYKSLSIFD